MRCRSVSSGDVTLAVREYGDPTLPTLVAVHGYPDSQQMWRPLAERASADLHVVSYDVRGAGGSSAPATTQGYRIERLVDDLVAVVDATAHGGAVHLLGHDWGSIQLWDAVTSESTDPRLTGRIVSFTSVSGPSLDHVAAAMRKAPWRSRLRQARHSWYVYAFHVPVLPELAWRLLHRPIGARLAASQRVPSDACWGRELARDGANGVGLYRANMLRRLRAPGNARTRVPVQLVVPRYDSFVPPALLRRVGEFVDELHRVDLEAGHWVPRTHPDELARLVTDWALRR